MKHNHLRLVVDNTKSHENKATTYRPQDLTVTELRGMLKMWGYTLVAEEGIASCHELGSTCVIVNDEGSLCLIGERRTTVEMCIGDVAPSLMNELRDGVWGARAISSGVHQAFGGAERQ